MFQTRNNMNLDDFLLEQQSKINPSIMDFFSSFMNQVFTQGFLNKIEKFYQFGTN